MKKLLLVFSLLSIIAIHSNAVGINGYFICGPTSSTLIADSEDDRIYTEIGVKSGNVLEVHITQPSSGSFSWEFQDFNTSSQMLSSGTNVAYIQVPSTNSYGTFFLLKVKSADKELSIKVFLLP